jgi:hypothetical protein
LPVAVYRAARSCSFTIGDDRAGQSIPSSMREVNFSIPNVNKASVGITTALYDRRALDCTSNLPLINSLNHLAYLTTSSARIREILTQDGGIERLVCILKQGRSRDAMDVWKWNLAFQCVVNIGVRGTEDIRTRVVEADMVPVIATILDVYNKVVEKCREKSELAKQTQSQANGQDHSQNQRQQQRQLKEQLRRQSAPQVQHGLHRPHDHVTTQSRQDNRYSQQRLEEGRYDNGGRQEQNSQRGHQNQEQEDNQNILRSRDLRLELQQDASLRGTQHFLSVPQGLRGPESHTRIDFPQERAVRRQPTPNIDLSAVNDNSMSAHHRHISSPNTINEPVASSDGGVNMETGIASSHVEDNHDTASSVMPAYNIRANSVQTSNAAELGNTRGARPVPGLGSATVTSVSAGQPYLSSILASQPISPTTPLPPSQVQTPTASILDRRRPSVRHQSSLSAESDDTSGDGPQLDDLRDAGMAGIVSDMQPLDIQGISMDDADGLLTQTGIRLTPPVVSDAQAIDTFNMAPHRDSVDALASHDDQVPGPPSGISPTRQTVMSTSQPSAQQATAPRFLMDRFYTPPIEVIAAMPRDEDILMSLQLLAYISKYCGLRSYFQKSHLVPKLRLNRELGILASDDGSAMIAKHEFAEPVTNEEEYTLPNDYNIFPLVEKFTVRVYSQDMQYWAGVVMRNLCRKDDTRGGIRQCAYYQCGRWEEYPRQFAKCRRCRRTKYCSKDCQKSAWAFHRHWCVSAS